jgi:uncharacterized protein YqeY
LSRDEIQDLARQVIATAGAADVRQFGSAIGALMPQVKGRADDRAVQEIVHSLLIPSKL